MWCDGLDPFHDERIEGRCALVGTAFMMDGPKGSKADLDWTFYAMLPTGVERRDVVNWRPFLPPPDAHGWVEIDVEDRSVTFWLSRWG